MADTPTPLETYRAQLERDIAALPLSDPRRLALLATLSLLPPPASPAAPEASAPAPPDPAPPG